MLNLSVQNEVGGHLVKGFFTNVKKDAILVRGGYPNLLHALNWNIKYIYETVALDAKREISSEIWKHSEYFYIYNVNLVAKYQNLCEK